LFARATLAVALEKIANSQAHYLDVI